jgi:hypothetical protein
MTWIALLERRGYPERAFEVFQRAEEQHAASIALLSFAVSFLARRARWEQAQTRLMRLRQTEGRAAFHEASVAFHRMRGEPRLALEHAEAWVRELPRSMDARFEVLALLRTLEGDAAAAARARQWMHAHPADQDFEEAFCRYAEGDLFWQKIRVLKRRVKRNAEDGWAWRELVFAALARYERADAGQRQRLRPRVEAWLAQAVRVRPSGWKTGTSGALRWIFIWKRFVWRRRSFMPIAAPGTALLVCQSWSGAQCGR